MKESIFLDKDVKVTLVNGFVLRGKVIDIDRFGIVLKSSQKTGYQSFNNIKDILEEC